MGCGCSKGQTEVTNPSSVSGQDGGSAFSKSRDKDRSPESAAPADPQQQAASGNKDNEAGQARPSVPAQEGNDELEELNQKNIGESEQPKDQAVVILGRNTASGAGTGAKRNKQSIIEVEECGDSRVITNLAGGRKNSSAAGEQGKGEAVEERKEEKKIIAAEERARPLVSGVSLRLNDFAAPPSQIKLKGHIATAANSNYMQDVREEIVDNSLDGPDMGIPSNAKPKEGKKPDQDSDDEFQI